jgi:hypothetical protein
MEPMTRATTMFCLTLAACTPWGAPRLDVDTGTADPADALVVSPASLDFGSLQVDGPGPWTREFTITNAGKRSITVHGHDEPVPLTDPPSEVFRVVSDEPIFSLAAGESRELVAEFDPPSDGDWRAEVRVNYGVEVLALRGTGTAPTLALSDVQVPNTPTGCESTFDLRIDNVGREHLMLETVEVIEGQDFALVTPLDGVPVTPGDGFDLALRFRPSWQGPDTGDRQGVLRLTTNDPLQAVANVGLEGFTYAGSEVTEAFGFHPATTVDLLILADTDGVMSAHVDKAQAATAPLLEAFEAANVDLHAAVLTGASSCPTTSPSWVDADDPMWRRESVLESGFEGISGAASDTLLDHAADALGHDSPSGCLEGFLRPGAALHVVVIAGGPDGSTHDAAQHLAALASLAPDAREIIVSAVIVTSGPDCGVTYGEGYAEAVLATDGQFVGLCELSWDPGFRDIAARSHEGVDGGLVHPLAEVPFLDSLSVQVDGTTFDDWHHDAGANAVVFPADTAPDPGSDVTIEYRIGQDCNESR